MANQLTPETAPTRAASGASQTVPHRALLTLCCMTGNLMQALDSTIANVSLPYMQGTLSTSAEEITWVLTSYVIAAAIMTAPVGWMAVRFGRKNLFITCMAGFVGASMLCGAAGTLEQMVAFRLLQGICGAALVPLSQATMLDIYPFERRAQAMAIFGMGVMVGPILGPTLGGYLTEAYSWRWVFYVNLPFGILALVGLMVFMPKAPVRPELRFDWTGFAALALGVGSLQLMLDRGQQLDWFTSREIIIEAVLAALGFYLFIVHMLTAPDPFLPPALFKDRNFVCGVLMVFSVAMIMLASSALLAPYLETLAGYPVATAGLAMAPRGLGTMIGMLLAARLSRRIDQRILMAAGLLTMGWALNAMSSWTPDVTERQMMLILVVQGLSIGFVFNPMTVMAFITLPSKYRGHATSLQALGRNIGQAIGVSVTSFMLTRGVQTNHADIAAFITPFDRTLQGHNAVERLIDPFTRSGAALLDRMVDQQAQIIAYNNDFRLMSLVVAPPLILLLFMRRSAPAVPTVQTASAPAGE